jgi:hypothetical protein
VTFQLKRASPETDLRPDAPPLSVLARFQPGGPTARAPPTGSLCRWEVSPSIGRIEPWIGLPSRHWPSLFVRRHSASLSLRPSGRLVMLDCRRRAATESKGRPHARHGYPARGGSTVGRWRPWVRLRTRRAPGRGLLVAARFLQVA